MTIQSESVNTDRAVTVLDATEACEIGYAAIDLVEPRIDDGGSLAKIRKKLDVRIREIAQLEEGDYQIGNLRFRVEANGNHTHVETGFTYQWPKVDFRAGRLHPDTREFVSAYLIWSGEKAGSVSLRWGNPLRAIDSLQRQKASL